MFIIVYIFVVQLTTKVFGFYLTFNVFYEKIEMD